MDVEVEVERGRSVQNSNPAAVRIARDLSTPRPDTQDFRWVGVFVINEYPWLQLSEFASGEFEEKLAIGEEGEWGGGWWNWNWKPGAAPGDGEERERVVSRLGEGERSLSLV